MNNINKEIANEDLKEQLDFIRMKVAEDLSKGKHKKIVTRFPPEPNGYLHIGHAKSIVLNFGIANEYNGICHLRLDDTNPEKEDIKYAESIKEDVKWLGYDWGENLFFASDYYNKLYQYAIQLIKNGKAYVDSLNEQEIKEYRGTAIKTKNGIPAPGKDSPYRNHSIEENLDLFERMRKGEFKDGEHVLRAKIDMTSPNLVMRDPVLYRIKRYNHYRKADEWCIYPMYDFAHCLSDSIEGITHSICTLEFEINRPLYDWVLDQLNTECHPQQIEFARLNITNTILSKRKLLQLVEEKYVSGWDDPRMPTIAGLRRRGYTPTAIRNFCKRIGISKTNSTIDIALLEHFVREDLNKKSPRVMAVLDPLKVVITNYPEDEEEWLDAENNPEDTTSGTRKIPFSKVIYIEKDDFQENPPKKYFRLSVGKEVRLKHAYYIKCENVIKNEKTGEIVELHCTYDPETKGGWSQDGRNVKGTSHWVSVKHSVKAEIRLYDHLILDSSQEAEIDDLDFKSRLNPNSIVILTESFVEPSLKNAKSGDSFQFLRQGYFCVDNDSTPNKLVFNRTVSLKDSWAKIEKKNT
ncbi:MAG: glutamine--tRNA ligase/YqeY domain fusion protein [Spirochaetota bacterium]|nr:glutamine--tRNA ligase/YqeY domain fusion protein [Spirochaetota bacterium]